MRHPNQWWCSPKSLVASGLSNPFTGKKKYTIQCGHCHHSYVDKVLTNNDSASSVCPCCKRQNMWSHYSFAVEYEKAFETHMQQRELGG